MKNKIWIWIVGMVLAFYFQRCTKEIELEFPPSETLLVVDGTIEPGSPPFIFLSHSNSFNQGMDPSSLGELLIHGATMTIETNNNVYPLNELCVDDLGDVELQLLSQSVGMSVESLLAVDYCIYTNLTLLGEIGQSYDLTIVYEGTTLHSTTQLLPPIALDSLWFEYNFTDTLGLINARLSDPANTYNAYRWFAQRINHRANGEIKDFNFIAPLGSAFDDKFFDGLTFDFFAARGSAINSTAVEDNNIEAGLFKKGDTIVVKLCAITKASFDFYFIMEDQIINNGSPFATPGNIPSNIEGGLGVWTGYSSYLDTLVVD